MVVYLPTKLDDVWGKCWDSYSSTMVRPWFTYGNGIYGIYGMEWGIFRLKTTEWLVWFVGEIP